MTVAAHQLRKKTFASHLNMRTVIKSRWSSSQRVRFCLVIMTVIIAVSIGRSLTDSLRFIPEEKKYHGKKKIGRFCLNRIVSSDEVNNKSFLTELV